MEERLQKYMAECGIASRRKCEQYILEERVKVNGQIVNKLGIKVDSSIDMVEFDNKIIKKEENKIYIMLNKPEGYICSVKDEKNRSTILDLIKCKERVYPVGRLDYDSSGLILLTNDGEIYNKIIHPRKEIIKTYVVKVKNQVSSEDRAAFENGIDIGGYVTAPATLKVLNYDEKKQIATLEIGIHEGKNRQIRRMCAALNHEVISLNRISVGKLKLAYLKKGQYRELTKEEIDYIKAL